MDRATLDRLIEARKARHAVALVTDIATGRQELVAREEVNGVPYAEALTEAFRFDRSGVIAAEGAELFVNVYNPPLSLIVVGAVHIAQALIPMARLAGYDVTVIDPRGAFASQERFPDVTLRADWPDEVLPGLALDQRSAMLALTHDPKIDDPALTAALQSDCFYIGALGSKKTHGARVERLTESGVPQGKIARIHAPIGLAIGARGPAEIAIAIMAELTQALRQGDTRP